MEVGDIVGLTLMSSLAAQKTSSSNAIKPSDLFQLDNNSVTAASMIQNKKPKKSMAIQQALLSQNVHGNTGLNAYNRISNSINTADVKVQKDVLA